MSSLEVFLLILFLGLLIILFLMWQFLYLQHQKDKDSQEEQENKNEDKEREERKRAEEAEQLRKNAEEESRRLQKLAEEEEARRIQLMYEQKVKEILWGDPDLGRRLLGYAGQKNVGVFQAASDADLVREIARKVRMEYIDLLHVAATQKDIDFDLKTKRQQVPVKYPTNSIVPQSMSDMDQLPGILPEQLMLDDDEFYSRLAQNDLTILQSHDTVVDRKTLHILMDASGSMKEAIGKLRRSIWARGVTLNLLLKAMRGDSQYLFRAFTAVPHELHSVFNQKQAGALMDTILGTNFEDGDTQILIAIKQAVQDIRNLNKGVGMSDILIITDGQDTNIKNSGMIKQLLGNDIRLHVASIGVESEQLKQAATSYRVFR